jgi:hypothetical protein
VAQLLEDGRQVLRTAVLHAHFAARDGGRHDERARLDAIRNDGVLRAVQGIDPLHDDGVGSGALDARSHLHEQRRQVLDLGLLRRVVQDGAPARAGRRHHEILRAGDGPGLEADLGSLQAFSFRHDVAVLHADAGAELG